MFRKVIQKKETGYSKSLKSTNHHQNQQVIPYDKYIIYFVENLEDRKATHACHGHVENFGSLVVTCGGTGLDRDWCLEWMLLDLTCQQRDQ